MMNADMDAVETENQVELEEKTRLINQVLELQHTLEDLSARVDAVKEENLKLKSENQVLGQYIENLMSASSVFQTTDTKSKRKKNVLWSICRIAPHCFITQTKTSVPDGMHGAVHIQNI
ncbi:short coiled-coil protein isoform X2 [Crotalus tigris]|nr:short coiled-coil protein isoform X2 [Crotalus tigris]XP_039194843.1 short coiled-coil protein isoform X2 [Crotalus tigris]XP_039194844.1 short coiled-coil protein isoform X2 [Crotalus tigris]